MLSPQKPVSQYDVRKNSETVITVADVLTSMKKTCIHDIQPNRWIPSISGTIVRSYPFSMKYAKGRWIPFRKIVLVDESGWVLVKIWGHGATEVLRGQQIQLMKPYCFQENGRLCLTLGVNAHLKICTQA